MNPAQDEFNALHSNQNQALTTHPEDVSTASSSDNDSTTLRSSSFDHPTPASNPKPGMPSAAYHIPSTITFHANTGPKGVIADARAFDTAKKRSFRSTFQAFSASSSPPRLGKSKKSALNSSREKSASPDVSADDDEDDFMRAWRVNRLAELASMSSSLRTRRHSPSPRKYGTLLAVDPAGYLDAVEKVSADTTVVVLIYDDESAASGIVEDALQNLARKHATTRFVKLHQLDAEMDDIAVPGVLAYRGGDCFANLVSIASELPAGRDMSASSLETILQRHKILV